ncbi:hypothetical protein CMUS01_10312, partial [Colletotrichum musicola]
MLLSKSTKSGPCSPTPRSQAPRMLSESAPNRPCEEELDAEGVDRGREGGEGDWKVGEGTSRRNRGPISGTMANWKFQTAAMQSRSATPRRAKSGPCFPIPRIQAVIALSRSARRNASTPRSV